MVEVASETMTEHEYFMSMAMAARKKANCKCRKVGAVLVKHKSVIGSGYNGTPHGTTPCMHGGCARCNDRERFGSSVGYDVCVCVHAEKRAIYAAARCGVPIDGVALYTTVSPCFDCLKSIVELGIQQVYYLEEWIPSDLQFKRQYLVLQSNIWCFQEIAMIDPENEWARNKPAGAKVKPSSGAPTVIELSNKGIEISGVENVTNPTSN